ncbi:MAG: ISL3 family transposase [Phycisphaerales bacterium]|nr:ISL3 family transposase [Phycisphaerales bacterium]
MGITSLPPDSEGLACDEVKVTPGRVTMILHATRRFGICPLCGRPSDRVHGRYSRTPVDLPWQGTTVQLTLRVRRFFCETTACPQRIFAERIPNVTGVHARKTCRLSAALEAIAFTCGGEGGARLAARPGMATSPDTLLRRIRGVSLNRDSTPRVLGVDEWAVRRHGNYGTILCDLERRQPVDLLEECSAKSFSTWLSQHAGIQIISRDRAGCFSQGASEGAPGATQVADRWHLLDNLRDALVRMLDRRHGDVQKAARLVASAASPQASPPEKRSPSPRRHRPSTAAQQLRQARRSRRLARYEQVLELHRQGVSQRTIARQIGLNRETVERYIRADTFPERASRQYRSRIDPYAGYLRQRWTEGCHNARQLTGELRPRGFDGSYLMVRRYVARWRTDVLETTGSSAGCAGAPPCVRTPSSKRVGAMLLKSNRSLEPHDAVLVRTLCGRCPPVGKAARLAREFASLVHRHQPEAFDPGLERSQQPGVPRELRSFGAVVKSDYAAVRAALTLPWSNGQVEGQINRLKLIKRQMYGRACFASACCTPDEGSITGRRQRDSVAGHRIRRGDADVAMMATIRFRPAAHPAGPQITKFAGEPFRSDPERHGYEPRARPVTAESP